MHNFFNKLSVRYKLVSIIMVTAGIVLFFAAAAFLGNDFFQLKSGLYQELKILADTIAIHSTAPLSFSDEEAANDTLSALRANSDITEAYLILKDSQIFARYLKGVQGGQEILEPLGIGAEIDPLVIKKLSVSGRFSLFDQYFDIYSPIVFDQEFIGVVAIRSNLTRLNNHLKVSAGIYGVTFILLTIFAYFLSSGISSRLTRPIQHLLETMGEVAKKKDYSIRACKDSDDEFGRLIDRFNEMISQIGKRDKELSITKQELDTEMGRRIQIEKQLAHSQKMEAIGTLAGGIAHDFNNILTAIFGYTQFIQMENAGHNKKIEEDAAILLKSANRARDLVQQLLTFSRQKRYEKLPLELKAMVKETVKLLRASCPSTIDIVGQIKKDCIVEVDPTQMHQILTNLGTNAMHALEEKGGKLTIELDRILLTANDLSDNQNIQPGEYASLAVIDNGVGIAPEICDRIFEPFFTTKAVGKGTGMGLSVVHGIVEKQNGIIQVESEVGKGTTFRVLLPVMTISDFNWPEPSSQLPPKAGVGHVLFVDDESVIRDIGVRMFSERGFQVTSADNGVEALKIVKEKKNAVDLLITDQTMPGMTGADLVKHVKQFNPELPIIMCTGNNTTISEEDALELGVCKYVLKPYGEELVDLACELLGPA